VLRPCNFTRVHTKKSFSFPLTTTQYHTSHSVNCQYFIWILCHLQNLIFYTQKIQQCRLCVLQTEVDQKLILMEHHFIRLSHPKTPRYVQSTLCFLFDNHCSVHRSKLTPSSIPYAANFIINLLCETLSKAFWKPKYRLQLNLISKNQGNLRLLSWWKNGINWLNVIYYKTKVCWVLLVN